MSAPTPTALDRLYETVIARKDAAADSSYTAKLFHKGLPKIAAKVSEEAGETVVAALAEDRDAVIAESADLLYHLCVLWAARDITPADVYDALTRREGVSGLAEKASRAPS